MLLVGETRSLGLERDRLVGGALDPSPLLWLERKTRAGDFVEVLVEATVETCEGRDVKGLYEKARAGEIPEFTGISAPYESPEKPELMLDSNRQSVEESVGSLIGYLEEKGYLERS